MVSTIFGEAETPWCEVAEDNMRIPTVLFSVIELYRSNSLAPPETIEQT